MKRLCRCLFVSPCFISVLLCTSCTGTTAHQNVGEFSETIHVYGEYGYGAFRQSLDVIADSLQFYKTHGEWPSSTADLAEAARSLDGSLDTSQFIRPKFKVEADGDLIVQWTNIDGAATSIRMPIIPNMNSSTAECTLNVISP